jgi:hypothetical protein
MSWLKEKVRYLHGTFHSSEVIWWARIQFVLLVVYQALQVVDLSLFISDHRLFQAYLFVNALVSEYLRRRNATYDENGNIK